MPVTATSPAPYAPASAIIGLIERHRNKGLPAPINADVLERASISPSLIPRTLQAMQTLDLIDGDGKPSQVLEGIRVAPQAEYQQRLASWLNSAYADALQFVDPATDDETKIRDAFRSYTPIGQQDRMVTLFTGLFSAAGIRSEKQRQSPQKPASAPAARSNRSAQKPLKSPPPAALQSATLGTPTLPPAMSGLLASLPSHGQGWQKAERDRFLQTFSAVLDFCFPTETVPKRRSHLEENETSETEQ